MHPDPQQLEELVRRIVEAVHPLRIVLFGSAARGEMGPESDLDVMVVMPEEVEEREVAMFLHTRLDGVPFAVDVLVVTPDELARYGDDIGFVYYDVLRQGREIYVSAA